MKTQALQRYLTLVGRFDESEIHKKVSFLVCVSTIKSRLHDHLYTDLNTPPNG